MNMGGVGAGVVLSVTGLVEECIQIFLRKGRSSR